MEWRNAHDNQWELNIWLSRIYRRDMTATHHLETRRLLLCVMITCLVIHSLGRVYWTLLQFPRHIIHSFGWLHVLSRAHLKSSATVPCDIMDMFYPPGWYEIGKKRTLSTSMSASKCNDIWFCSFARCCGCRLSVCTEKPSNAIWIYSSTKYRSSLHHISVVVCRWTTAAATHIVNCHILYKYRVPRLVYRSLVPFLTNQNVYFVLLSVADWLGRSSICHKIKSLIWMNSLYTSIHYDKMNMKWCFWLWVWCTPNHGLLCDDMIWDSQSPGPGSWLTRMDDVCVCVNRICVEW